MGLAEPSCRCSVVSASWSCAGPCHVWLSSKISGIITQRPTSSGTWLNEQLGWCLDLLSTGACCSHGRCRVDVSPSTPHLMTVMPYSFSGGRITTWTLSQKNIRRWCISSAPHHDQAVLTLVYCEPQMTISKNLARRQLTASNTTSKLMTA